MNDLIDRQEAIERIVRIRPSTPKQSDYSHGVDVGMAMAIVAIKEQPSAQPDVPDTNVGDLISREAMSYAVNTIRMSKNETWYSFYQKVLNELCKSPSVDAKPVRHGRWVIDRDGNWSCDQCGNAPYHCDMENMHFCPNCGADMRGE